MDDNQPMNDLPNDEKPKRPRGRPRVRPLRDPNEPPRRKGRPPKYGGPRPHKTFRLLDKRSDILDFSDLKLEGELDIADLIDETRRNAIPTFTPRKNMIARIDDLIKIKEPSPLLGRNVFDPRLTQEEAQSLNARERLRVSLLRGKPIFLMVDPKEYEFSTIPQDQIPRKRLSKYQPDFALFGTKFKIQTADGSVYHAILVWQAGSSAGKDVRVNARGWYRILHETKTRMTALMGGTVRNLQAKFHSKISDPAIPRLYPVLVTRPVNPKMQPQHFSRDQASRSEEEFMLEILKRVQILPPLMLEDRTYNLNYEQLAHEERDRYAADMVEYERKRDILKERLRVEANEKEQEFREQYTEAEAAMFATKWFEDQLAQDKTIPLPREIRASLLQDHIHPEEAHYIPQQGAVALLVSDEDSVMRGLPSTKPSDVLGITGTWKNFNSKMAERDEAKKIPRSEPNLKKFLEPGGYLLAKTDSNFIQVVLTDKSPVTKLDAWPSFLPPRDENLKHDESMRMTEYDPALAIRIIDPERVFGSVTDEEVAKASCEEEIINLLSIRSRNSRRIAVLLAPGQVIAHTRKFFQTDQRASRIFELPGGYLLLIFGRCDKLTWRSPETQSFSEILSIIRGRPLPRAEDILPTIEPLPYDEYEEMSNTEEPESAFGGGHL